MQCCIFAILANTVILQFWLTLRKAPNWSSRKSRLDLFSGRSKLL